MTWLDYGIVGAFLASMALIGLRISRLIKNPDDIFVAGRELPAFVLAATITATNLSMFHFISMGGIAYQKGISIIWQNWTGCMMLVISGIFVIPVMRRLAIRSIPEFLEMRYSRSLRILIGAFWGLRLCIFLGIFLYIAATASTVITGWDNYIGWLMIFSLIAIMYSAIGGAWAVAIMDSMQFAFIIAGALVTFPIAMHLAGGLPNLIHWLLANGEEMHVQLVPRSGEFGWLFILAILIISAKWAMVDQVILQRAFGARSPRVGAQGMVLSGLITTPLAFLWILPGLALAKIHPGITNPDHAIPWLLSTHLPMIGRGLLGFVLCGLVAAQISTITADVNSVATLFTSDVYRKLRRQEPTQGQLLTVARFSSLVCGVLMLLVAYGLKFTDSGAVRANLAVVGVVDLPLFVITILFGMLWKRTTWQGAMAGFFSGGAIGIFSYFVIVPKYFASLHHLLAIWPWIAKWAEGIHAHLKVYDPSILSIAPFVSSGAAIVVTTVVSLLTRQSKNGEEVKIWAALKSSASPDDDFPLVPRSSAARLGVALIVGGFVCFLGGIISAAAWGFAPATNLAVGGMAVLFVGGVVRVYTD